VFQRALIAVHEKVDGLDAGVVDCIAKPFDAEELRARIRTHLREAPPPGCRRVAERDARRELSPVVQTGLAAARICGTPLLDVDEKSRLARLLREPKNVKDLLTRVKEDVGILKRSLWSIAGEPNT